MKGSAYRPVGARAPRGVRPPSLEDLCVQTAIDNLQYLGDVGQTDLSLLAKILPHCNADQLHRIETSTTGRDLSPVTNELWRQFYSRKFGPESVNLVIERMKKKRVSFKWHLLYQAKVREQEEVQKKCVDRLKQLYKEADMQKQSRQTQMCTKVPPSSKRKSIHSGAGSSSQFNHIKGRLMKKARIEFAKSEAQMPKNNMRQLPAKFCAQRTVPSTIPIQKSASSVSMLKPSSIRLMCTKK